MPAERTLGFIGTGQMATALARGFLKAGLVNPADLVGSDPNPEARQRFAAETGARTVSDNLALLPQVQVILLAVKPDQVLPVLSELRPAFGSQHLLISIAAGVSLARMESALPAGARVVRVMPNTAALVGASATAFSRGRHASSEDAGLTQRLFGSVGMAIEVNESLLDAVTGLSGSGPAYVAQFVEALVDGGVACGLSRATALPLALQTLLGTVRLMIEQGLRPVQVKEMVTSPGGTTIEGLHALAEGAFHATVMNAVRRAAEKSIRLGQNGHAPPAR